MAAGMLVIQTAPFVIAIIVMVWLVYSLFGDMVDQRVLLINSSARKLTRRFSSGVISAAHVKLKPQDVSSAAQGDPKELPTTPSSGVVADHREDP